MKTTSTGHERTAWSDAVARQIAAERAYRRWTQAEMVERSGIPRSTYIRLENGSRVADVSQIFRICEALGIKHSEFTQRVEERLTAA